MIVTIQHGILGILNQFKTNVISNNYEIIPIVILSRLRLKISENTCVSFSRFDFRFLFTVIATHIITYIYVYIGIIKI